MLCCICFSPPTAGNGGSCRDDDNFWSLESIGVNAPVPTMTDSGTCSNNQNYLCCISSSPLTARNYVRPYSDVHDFWSLGSRGIDSPVSSVTDSVESVIEGKSSKTCENKRYSGTLPGREKQAKMTDSGTCSDNQNDLCCISSSPPTAGNGARPYSDVHEFWSLGSIGINAPVSSMTASATCNVLINRMIQL